MSYMNRICSILLDGERYLDAQIKVSLYADDIAIFAGIPETLQRIVNKLSEHSVKWNLRINISKSKILIC